MLGWPGGPEETALRAAAETYNAKPDVADADKVELIFFNRDGFFDKLQADLGAGSTPSTSTCSPPTPSAATRRSWRRSSCRPRPRRSSATPVLATMQFDGKQYGVPTDLSLHFMYYRKDLIDELLSDPAAKAKYTEIAKEKLGKELAPKDPDQWTWDDFEATALYFTKEINPDSPTRYGTVLQMKNLLFNMMVLHSLPRSYGGDWMDADGKITVDSDAYRKGLELYKRLYDAGVTPEDSLSYEYAEANAAFGSGQVATMLQWNAAVGDLTTPRRRRRSPR